MAVSIRVLQKDDKRDLFDAGDAHLNQYLKLYAWQNQSRRRIGTTYVAIEEALPRLILGYYTLAMSGIPKTDFPAGTAEKLTPYDPISVVMIGRLAVDKRARGKGLGEALLIHALRNILKLSEAAGCCGVVVDAYPPAIPFYEKYGFTKIGKTSSGERPQKLFLDIRTLLKSQK